MAKKKRVRWTLEKVDLGKHIEWHVSDGVDSASTFEACCDLLNAKDEEIARLKKDLKDLKRVVLSDEHNRRALSEIREIVANLDSRKID